MIIDSIKELIDIDSPSGYTDNIIKHIYSRLKDYPYEMKITNKGALIVSMNNAPKSIIAVHIDTLGGMVSGINEDGTLQITQIGGWPVNSFEGEYVTIVGKKKTRGTFLLKNPAAHVNKKIVSTQRDMAMMHIRLDIESKSKKETLDSDINIGDFVLFDTRFEHTDTGFIKSRFMDDKACAGIVYDILLNNMEELRNKSIAFYFSNYEEVGHGVSAGLPDTIEEMLVADMGVVGNGVEGDEYNVSICAKDSSGPYDFNMRNKLINIAKEKNISYKMDIFPYYGSDGSAALRAGYNLRIALIGPGVSASHGVERVHIKGLNATKDLLLAYMDSF